VCELVQDRQRTALDDGLGDLGTEDVHLVVRYRSGILHRAHVVLGGEDLVVLGERVRAVELVLVEREPAFGDVEDVGGVQVWGQRLAAQDAQRHGAVAGLDLVADQVVRPGDQRGDVAGDARGGCKGPHRGGNPSGGRGCHGRRCRLVGDDLPVRGGGDREGEGGLEVRLLEYGEHSPAVGDLELGVQVDRFVDRVDEAVEAFAGVHVDPGRIDCQLVVARPQRRELNPNTVEMRCRLQRLAVEGDLLDRRRDQVNEGAGTLPGSGEGDR